MSDNNEFAATQAMAPVPPISDDPSETEATVQMSSEGINAVLADLGAGPPPSAPNGGGEEEATMLMTDDMVREAEQRASQNAPRPQQRQQPPRPQQPQHRPPQLHTPQPGMMRPGMQPGMMPPGMQPGMMPPPQGRPVGLMIAIGIVAAAILGGIVFLFISLAG